MVVLGAVLVLEIAAIIVGLLLDEPLIAGIGLGHFMGTVPIYLFAIEEGSRFSLRRFIFGDD